MQPDPAHLIDALSLHEPLIGFYDAPDASPFAPLVEPAPGSRACVFSFRSHWLHGRTLHLTRELHGCGGAGRALCAVEGREREDFITFLCDDEGLRASRGLMAAWIDANPPYHQRHDHLLLGPLRPEQAAHLRTVTFLVDPDQLSILITGAYYDAHPSDPPPVIAPFGAGCMDLATVFPDLDIPQAAVGGTDIAMRSWLPAGLLAFAVTVPMFARLCALDDRSFLGKGFLRGLRHARGSRWGKTSIDQQPPDGGAS